MNVSHARQTALRDAAQERTGGRCAYCGSYVIDVSSACLDFFRPLSHGGSADESNAFLACARCNAYKGAYWHENDPPYIPLLHPFHDRAADHFREDSNGVLVPLSPRGEFHAQRLQLNRPSLVEQRRALQLIARARVVEAALRQRLHDMRAAQPLPSEPPDARRPA